MFNFCPSCASKKIIFEEGKVFRCPDCEFIYYHNNAAANGCLISVPAQCGSLDEEKLVFLVRSKEPSLGLLDLPGGFVDPGEGIYEGLYRELREELGWAPPIPSGANLSDVFKLFASFHNEYEYKGIKYNTCDMYFHVSAPGLTLEDLQLEEAEISGACFLKRDEINFDKLAFEATKKAIKAYEAFSKLTEF